jgi:nicotinamidase-related amidase
MADDARQMPRPWESVFSDEELRIYELYRRPGRLPFPWESSALLVIDVTEEFVGPRAPTIEAARSVRTATGLPAWLAVDAIGSLITAFREATRPVLYTRSFPGERFGGAAVGAANAAVTARIVDEVSPVRGELVIEKPRASAFFGTPLTSHLITSGIQGLVIVGGTTSGCVRASTLDASSLGFSVVIAYEGCFDRSQLSHWVALQELDVKYATVLDSVTIGELLRARASGPSRPALARMGRT